MEEVVEVEVVVEEEEESVSSKIWPMRRGNLSFGSLGGASEQGAPKARQERLFRRDASHYMKQNAEMHAEMCC